MSQLQTTVSDFKTGEPDLSKLTPAEREAFETVELQADVGPREFADKTDRSPGTVSNLLRRAWNKLDIEKEDWR